MSSLPENHVHFVAPLASPPADRTRSGAPYPLVAQQKGASDRRNNKDLFWGNRSLSSASSAAEREEEVETTLRLVTEMSRVQKSYIAESQNAPSIHLPATVRNMLLEALTDLPSTPKAKSLRPSPFFLQPWSCNSSRSTSTSHTRPSSYHGSSDCSTATSCVTTPSDESPPESIFTHSSSLGGLCSQDRKAGR